MKTHQKLITGQALTEAAKKFSPDIFAAGREQPAMQKRRMALDDRIATRSPKQPRIYSPSK